MARNKIIPKKRKKTYVKPAVEVFNMATVTMLASSCVGISNEEIDSGNIDDMEFLGCKKSETNVWDEIW